MSPNLPQSQQPLYQADPAFSQSVKSVHEKLYNVCHHHNSRPVRIQMMNGQVHEGVIVNIDEGHLYLQVGQSDNRAFFNPWGPSPWAYQQNVILPLVLYNLLVISLL
ncbi:acetyl-CoA acetyltransferase [Paenibacillus qinlingensis]|uniref:Acetyl-CoA acetyltransferase n=1 Tax=Paenibacillus qinlingensis TaxID=1837343 RepID=A0ABU1NTW3_9BACL|nr:acetyl-CoA acetyltransferase [Paenibacillus qinlingensis]MDR6550883.1 hypothetical protein [Paenibacillus qinlingensis]